MRKFVCAAVVTAFAVSVAMSGEYAGRITKIDGDKVTFVKKGKKGDKGEEITLTLAKDAKIVKGKFDKETKKFVAGDAIEGGKTALSDLVTKGGEKGAGAVIVTDDGDKNITEIRVMGGKKKKKDAN